jgi:hypothetical protein
MRRFRFEDLEIWKMAIDAADKLFVSRKITNFQKSLISK